MTQGWDGPPGPHRGGNQREPSGRRLFEQSGDFERGVFFLPRAAEAQAPAGRGDAPASAEQPRQAVAAEWHEPGGALEPGAHAAGRRRVLLADAPRPGEGVGPASGLPPSPGPDGVRGILKRKGSTPAVSRTGSSESPSLKRIGSTVSRTNSSESLSRPLSPPPAPERALSLLPAHQSQVRVAYMVEHGLDICDRFAALQNLQTAILCANRLSALGPLAELPHLRLLDVSDNSIQHVMGVSGRPRGFKRLAVLFLHRNLVKRPGALAMLGQARTVRALTLYGNPLAKDEFYRPGVFSAIPGLLALDFKLKIPHDNYIFASTSAEVVVDLELLALAKGGHQAAATAQAHVTTVHSDPLHVHHVAARSVNQNFNDVEREFKLEILKARVPRDHLNREIMGGWALRRFLVRCQLALPRAHLSLGSKSSLEDFTSVADEIVTKVHRLYSSCNPALVVQRCVRGHLGRRFFRRYRIRVMMPTVALQRWYSCREIREWKARQSVFSMVSDDENAADIRMLPLSSDTVAFENLESPSDLYFLPQDIARLKSLLRTVSKIFPKGALPNLQVSNLVLLDVGHGSISRWIPYFHVLVKREYRQRPLGKATRIGFLRHGITRDASLLVLKRRTGPPSKSLYKMFVDTYAAKNVPAHVSSCHGASWTRRYLLVLRFSSQHSRGLFIRVLNNINASMGRDALKYLLQEVVVRMTAACSIQCAVRSWLKRRRMRPSLGTAIFVLRAIRLLQRWWRWKLLFWRISCLRQVQDAVALNGDAAVLFCFASNLKKRLEVDKIAKPLFREAKFHFDFDAEGKIFVHQMGQAGHEAVSLDQQLGEPASRRPFLPQWVGLFSNRSEGVQSPDEHSPAIRASVWHRALDVPQENIGAPSSLKSILQTDCQASLAETSSRAVWHDRTDDSENEGESWKLPGRQLLGMAPVLRLKFSSALEARRRMSILLIRTYRPRTRDSVQLLSLQRAAKHVWAVYIQAVFRGHLTRTWWRLITLFLRERLQTSFLEQRVRSNVKADLSCESGVLLSSLPESLRQVLNRIGVSEDQLSSLVYKRLWASDSFKRGPKVRLSRDRGVRFHATESDNAAEMVVCRPTLGQKGEGGGLPSAGGKDKAFVGNLMRQEKQHRNDTRAMMQLIDVKRKVDRNEIARGRHQVQVDLLSRPDKMNMRVFEILQPPPPTMHEIELSHRRQKMQVQKGLHKEIMEMRKTVREELLTARQKERNAERRLALFAKDLYGIPNHLQSVMSKTKVLIQDDLSGPFGAISTADTGGVSSLPNAKLERARTPSQLPTLMSRRVDKIIHSRAQSAAKAAIEERKANNSRMKISMSTSLLTSSNSLRESRKAQVHHVKRNLVALQMHRQQIDEQWEHWLAQKPLSRRPSEASQEPLHHGRPATSHVDLRPYVRTPDAKGLLKVDASAKNHERLAGTHMWGAAGGHANTSLPLDGAARDPHRGSAEHLQALLPGVRTDVGQDIHDEPKGKRERIADERPVSAIARDRLLESSGVNLTINLERTVRDIVPSPHVVSPHL